MISNITINTSKSVENEAIVTNLQCTNADGISVNVPKISVNNMYMKFAGKLINVLNALASKKRFFYSYRISVLNAKNTSDTDIIVHVIKSKDGSSELFEPLRRLGIMLTELKIGRSVDGKRLYLTNKVLRDFNKFGDDIKMELTMYLISISYAFEGIVQETPSLNNIYGGILSTSIVDWNSYVYSFTDGQTVEVTEIPTDDLRGIRYYNNIYSTPSRLSSAYPDNEFSIVYNDERRYLVISRVFDKNTFWIYSHIKRCVYTNETLISMCMDYDTFPAGFTHAVGSTVDVRYTEDLRKALFDEDKEHTVTTELEEDVFVEDKIFSKIVSCYNSSTGISLNKFKGLIPTCKISTGVVDKEAMLEQYKEDAYAQQLYKQAQDYYDDFDLKSLNNTVRGFSNGDVYAMMFIGSAGTGKSTSARVIPYRCGIPYISINFCVNIEESDLVGTMIPNPEKNKPEDPEFIWQDGLITKAVRNGYCVILEEINFARPGVLGKLNSLLDENRQIDLPNGEILKAHPNFRMIATCNIAYEGTNRFNKALINRFEMVHEFKDLDKTETFKTLKSRIKGIDDTKLAKVYNIYELLKKFANEQTLDIVVSIRQLFNIFRQGKYYANAYDAILDILVNGAFIELPEYKDRFVTAFEEMKKDYMFKL